MDFKNLRWNFNLVLAEQRRFDQESWPGGHLFYKNMILI